MMCGIDAEIRTRASGTLPSTALAGDWRTISSWSSRRRSKHRELQVSEIARGLKELAMELSCTVIAPAQLNPRAIEGRADPTPTLADLRERARLSEAADQVAFIVRPEKFDPETDQKGIGILLHVVKHRDGQPGAIPCASTLPAYLLRRPDLPHTRGH